MSESPVELARVRVRDDLCCRVEDTLQLVSHLLWSANHETAAIIDSACDERMPQMLSFEGVWGTRSNLEYLMKTAQLNNNHKSVTITTNVQPPVFHSYSHQLQHGSAKTAQCFHSTWDSLYWPQCHIFNVNEITECNSSTVNYERIKSQTRQSEFTYFLKGAIASVFHQVQSEGEIHAVCKLHKQIHCVSIATEFLHRTYDSSNATTLYLRSSSLITAQPHAGSGSGHQRMRPNLCPGWIL